MSSRSRNILIALFILVDAGIALWYFPHSGGGDAAVSSNGRTPKHAPSLQVPELNEPVKPAASPAPVVPADAPRPQAAVPAAPMRPVDASLPENSQPVAMAAIDRVKLMLRDYRTLMGENPVGTNAEITHALMGGNPKQAVLGPADREGISESGEMLDPWGTPYFFHQLSAIQMEIRSAGPDRKMYTADDVVSR